jgi:hypothetical protein
MLRRVVADRRLGRRERQLRSKPDFRPALSERPAFGRNLRDYPAYPRLEEVYRNQRPNQHPARGRDTFRDTFRVTEGIGGESAVWKNKRLRPSSPLGYPLQPVRFP